MRIVVIEDEIRIREGLCRLLGKLNEEYELAGEADNGEDGIRIVREKQPDVIITDIRMPIMDGLEMLEQLYAEGFTGRAIVLSAYSEFDYARTAIRLGVTEYLLKPIVVSELSQVLAKVKNLIEEKAKTNTGLVKNMNQLLQSVLWGGVEIDEEMSRHVKSRFGVCTTEPMIEICLYLGKHLEEQKASLSEELTNMFSEHKGTQFCILEDKKERVLLLLLYGYTDSRMLERWFQKWLLTKRSEKQFPVAAGWIEAENIRALKSSLETLYPYMEWNITFGEEVMISYPKIKNVQTVPCIYPLEIENKIKGAICAGDLEKTKEVQKEFQAYFQDGLIYFPREVKECYVRFLWAVLNIAKEIGLFDVKSLSQQKLLEQIMSARTIEELEEASVLLYGRMEKENDTAVTHLTVKKAQDMIHEFYRSGITLEEIAERLNITPEYLGTQFRKEVGVTFGTYIKNYRMMKAKELLLGTSLKLYEVAEQVGYTDPKYFSRVFKASTGQLPADYRKTNK